ncbi:MAG: acetyl-CoA carboxylase carboxyltransferase subunit alpha [Chitinophagales bacterium]|nr:acetyl-CoA carboxylase carboxyltransferase subunit alpha [Bacteroidota bacterium]MCB9257611.1 acetyl-CoA carboxylase carboxyltransferase subunit alpha [Chitinophagales bacterium]
MNFLNFEEPIAQLYEKREQLIQMQTQGDLNLDDKIAELDKLIEEKKEKLYSKLSAWQRVQLSRHPDRPYSLFYIHHIFDNFIELHGDRKAGDDKAIVGGIAQLDGQGVVVIGHQKGVNTKMRQYRNFGMANPEGYRKALRLMKLAEKFNKPIISFIDTPGAYPGIAAEEFGQAEAIARNLYEMTGLKVPVISIIIGEGASGGAIGIGVCDKLLMLENTWFTVISPESCSSILWRSWDFKEQAAEQLKLTANDMHKMKIVDSIVKEPLGGAHNDREEMAKTLKRAIKRNLTTLLEMDPQERIAKRIAKYDAIGTFEERKLQ